MKNKTKLLILSIIASLTFTSALASCGKKGGGNDGGAQSSSSSVVDGSENESSSVVDGSENESSSVVTPPESSVTVTVNGATTVAEFETVTLMAVVIGAEDDAVVEWSSSDASIASVDQSGVVTAKKTGNVTITATVDGVSATHALEVTATPYMHEIEFDLDQVSIYEGEEGEVEAYVVFNGEELDSEELGLTYTWEKVSGDDVVTLVADGAVAKFTTKATGTAVYKVTTVARGYEVSKTINVTVMANDYGYKFTNDKISMANDVYQASLMLIADATLTIGDVIGVKNGEPTTDVLTVEWTTDSDVISVEDGVITALKAGEGTITGTTSYQGEDFTIALKVSVAKNQVAIEGKTISIEAITDAMDISALAEDIKEEIKEIKIGDLAVFSGTTSVGEIALAARPVKAADLGEGKTMTIETDTTFYTVNVNVYTMIINNAEELDQWQAVAAQNAVDAGLCIAEQLGMTYSGYFILGDNIEYNKTWTTYKKYGELWALCYNNQSMWKDPTNFANSKTAGEGQLLDGAFQEDWGAGRQGGFHGTFDGDGHHINGLQTSGEYSGFVVTMGINGTFKDISFTNAKIGANCGLLANRGGGSYENVFVEVAAMESGLSKDNYSAVISRDSGSGSERNYDNIVVDLSRVDFASLDYAFVASCGEDKANGIYVLGADDVPLSRSSWEAGSGENGSWNEKQATIFFAYEADNDVVGSFASVADLLVDETHGAAVKAWDNGFWTVTDTVVIAASVLEGYKAGALEITNTDLKVNAGRSVIVTTNKNKAYVSFALKNEVAGVSIVKNVVSVAEDVEIGTTFTVVATSLLDGTIIDEIEFTSAPKIVAHEYTTTVETYNNNKIELPTDLEGTIAKITVGSHVVYDAANSVGSIEGTTLTVGSMPSKMSDLGDNVKMTVETDAAKYEMYINVYTMIIDSVEELDQWQSVAADNSVAAGLCIAEQKKGVLSGYFVLGDDIAYNKQWTPILTYGNIWGVLDAGSDNVKKWVADYGADKVIQEDWGHGIKGGFQGVFDGKGHEIKGMEIKGEYVGFIVTIGINGVVKNVAFTDVKVGAKAGVIERGGGGSIENVYVDIAEMESGVGPDDAETARIFSAGGNANLKNIVINATDCDFTGVEYVAFANMAYVDAENVYVIDRDYVGFTTQKFEEGKGPYAFRHFNTETDKGGKFATVADLLADATHGTIVSELGGYWKVEEGKLYFGDLEVVTAPEKEIIVDEYKTNIDKQVTLESENLTVGSVWNMSIGGGEATEVTVAEEGKLTVSIDPATVDGDSTSVVLSSADMVITFANVIVVEKIVDETEYKTDANKQVTLENENFTVDSVWSMSINDGEAVEFTVTEEGKATLSIDPVTLDSWQVKVLFRSTDKAISFSNVIAVTYISTAEELKALGVGGKVVTTVVVENDIEKSVDHNIGNGAVADQHKRGYYMLSEDIDASGIEFAAGYAWTNARFKGVFDGNGKTVSNIMVGEGGIFGAVEGAVIKNVNFKNVLFYGTGAPGYKVNTAGSNGGGTGLNNTDQWGLYAAVLGYSANNVVVSDLTMTVSEYYYNNASLAGRTSFLFINNNGKNTYKNITIDASKLDVASVLGAEVDKDDTYENVSVKAASYLLIGKSEDSDSATALTEFPAGVKFERVSKYLLNNGSSVELPAYDGDETALGFAEGTTVYAVEQDNRSNMWEAGTNLKLSMEQQALIIYKDANEDYASVQFSLSRDIPSDATYAFFSWVNFADGNGAAGGYLKNDGTAVASAADTGFNVAAYDADGNLVTTGFKANTVYTMKWYYTNATKFKIGCCVQDGNSITVYFANMSSGNDPVADAE